MSLELKVRVRSEMGRAAVRRLRRGGEVPAILYGHREENIPLAVSAADIHHLVTLGTKLVELRGAVNQSALVREVQWDPFGAEVLHVDFFRVSAEEKVATTVPILLRGEAVGSRSGGIVEQVLHEIDIECPVGLLPDRLELNIQPLQVGSALHVRDLVLPAGARALADPELIVVHCVLPRGAQAEAPAAPTPSEPELVGRKPATEEEQQE